MSSTKDHKVIMLIGGAIACLAFIPAMVSMVLIVKTDESQKQMLAGIERVFGLSIPHESVNLVAFGSLIGFAVGVGIYGMAKLSLWWGRN